MSGQEFLLFLFLSFAVARVTRFIASDDLWKEMREGLIDRLEDPRVKADRGKDPEEDEVTMKSALRYAVAMKISTLITCAWCVSIYVSAGLLIVTRQAEIHFGWGASSIPMPVWYWLGLSMVSVLQIEATDGVKEVRQVK